MASDRQASYFKIKLLQNSLTTSYLEF